MKTVKPRRANVTEVESSRAYLVGAGVQERCGLVDMHPRKYQDFFPRTLSLDRLIAWWEREALGDEPLGPMARNIVRDLERAPELRGSLTDWSVLRRHEALVDAMMAAVFPAALRNLAFSAASLAGDLQVFYATPRFRRVFLDETGLRGQPLDEDFSLESLIAIFSCMGVLRRVYGQDIPFEKSIIIRVPGPPTSRYYQMRAHLDFAEIRVQGTLPELPPEALPELRASVTDLNLWRRFLPRDSFEFYGFVVQDAVDVTEEVCISGLKQELVGRDPLGSGERVGRLQEWLRSLLGVPDLSLNVAAVQGDQGFVIGPCSGAVRLMDLDPQHRVSLAALRDCTRDGAAVHPELEKTGDCNPFLRRFVAAGCRSAVVATFGEDEEVNGFLAVASGEPGVLNSTTEVKLRSVLPLFAVAVRRTTDSMRSTLQTIMKEQFTAIHPAIEWRFAAAALRYLQRSDPGEGIEEIVFGDVLPLFGSSDIRSSSVLRNEAVQADLAEQLRLAEQVLACAFKEQSLPYLDSLRFRVRQWLQEIGPGLQSGDDTRILEFLRHELEPLFPRLETFGPKTARAAQAYRQALDPRLGILYQRRRSFDESVAEIRECITGILYARQEEAQKFLPHYFEMHKTDGVDHTIYVGASMMADEHFDPLYLRNLRLWQLLVMVEIARATRDMVPRLAVPLETAHLILAQDTPLSIRFHADEKQFNVDGAYNVRYEIMKKRLDKAEVDGTGERLTLPDRVAIVYSHPREGSEYREYLDYLVDAGQLRPGVEELTLGPLQGVHGLKALRVTIA